MEAFLLFPRRTEKLFQPLFLFSKMTIRGTVRRSREGRGHAHAPVPGLHLHPLERERGRSQLFPCPAGQVAHRCLGTPASERQRLPSWDLPIGSHLWLLSGSCQERGEKPPCEPVSRLKFRRLQLPEAEDWSCSVFAVFSCKLFLALGWTLQILCISACSLQINVISKHRAIILSMVPDSVWDYKS